MVSAASNPFSFRPSGAARPFVLRPDWNGVVQKREVVDVNLGHTPESFVRAAHAQITGLPAPEALVRRWARELRDSPRLRRVDLVRLLARENGRSCQLCYGDPWQAHPELVGAPERGTARQVGAVWVCGGAPDDASTHPLGADLRRELTDAKWAGLDFLLLSAAGPSIDLAQLDALDQALAAASDPVKIALFDRSEPAATAIASYEAKWQPFFRRVDRHHWYRFKGKPFVYFSSGAPLGSSELLAQLKQLFEIELGETPFLCVESACFDDPGVEQLADARFTWSSFDLPEKRSRSSLNGHVVDHALVRWDAVGRDRPGELATSGDLRVLGSELLEQVLWDSSDAELLVLGSWNDLAAGSGIHRNYDYWVNGSWLSPEHFMRKVRVSQSTERGRRERRLRIGSPNVIG